MKKFLLSLFVALAGCCTAQAQELFKATFDEVKGVGGTDGYWRGATKTDDASYPKEVAKEAVKTCDGFTGLENAYAANACLKMGTAKKAGTLTTNAINHKGDVTLSFKAGAWDTASELLNLTITATNGTVAPAMVTIKKAAFGSYTVNIKGVSAATQITIAPEKAENNRYFIDDIVVVAGASSEVSPEVTPEPTPTPAPNPAPDSKAIYEKALTDNADGWTFEQGTLPEGLKAVWTQDNKYGIKATAFVKPNKFAAEAWAISPVINLTTDNVLTFEHAQRFTTTPAEELTLWVREGENGTWQPLSIPTYPDGKNWNYISSGDIKLSAFNGKSVQFGFKYVSTTESAGTWEVKNFKVTGNPTALTTIRTAPADATIYDLSGRRVRNAEKGVFIVNGKKVMR